MNLITNQNNKKMNKRVAILATNGFEESELKSPLEAMKNEGFTVDIVSQESLSLIHI